MWKMTFIKTHWKLIAIAILALIVILWISSVTGTSRKIYDMMLDQLSTDQSQIIKDKEAWIKDCEDEIKQLAQEKAKIQQEKLAVQRQAQESAIEVARLTGRVNDLQEKLRNIVIPTDVDALIRDLRGRGIDIERYSPASDR